MSDRVQLAIDVMGGDFGLHTILPASISSLNRHKSLYISLVGDAVAIQSYLEKSNTSQTVLDRIKIVPSSSVVQMSDKPSFALRHRRDSSMYLALQLLATQKVDACVSAGNTGALMAMSCLLVKMIEGISRPAIVAEVPTGRGQCVVLDLGANLHCKAGNLLQFSVMGSSLAQTVSGIQSPKVGLLNIGSEENKGLPQVVAAATLLAKHPAINYQGFVEGDDVFAGKVDVVVCDGFAGNVLLKSSEGLAKFINLKVARNLKKNWFRRFLTLVARPVLKELRQELDPARRNGALLIGLKGVVVKSHGGASGQGFGYAIDQAVAAVENRLPETIEAVMRQSEIV